MGCNKDATPKTSAMLQMLLPMTFPTAIMLLSLTEDTTLMTNSGADVPKATTVKPITIGDKPMLLARLDEPLTSMPAP